MKLHIFGTCSGTEPFHGRHHVSFSVDVGGGLYWFDAGECCSYTAHLMGVDILRTRKICISHTHMDHIGGLANLFWTIRKLDGMRHVMKGKTIELFIPGLTVWDGIMQILKQTEGNFSCNFDINAFEFDDGLVFDDGHLCVSALHNRHLVHVDGSPWRSFGFSIAAEGKKVVYSGDTKGIDDFSPMLGNCDLLLMETGHHHPIEVAKELIARDLMPKKLAFIHHGMDILLDYNHQKNALHELLGERVCVLEDGITIEV